MNEIKPMVTSSEKDDFEGVTLALTPKVHRCLFCDEMSRLQEMAKTQTREQLRENGVSEKMIDYLIALNTRPEWSPRLAACSDDEL
jgi:hypothetical protein